MKRIGMPVARMDVDAPPAEHFGKAKWLAILEPEGACRFVPNAGPDGRTAAAELAAHGCTDVVARHMGCGAYAHVTGAGMRAWRGDDAVTPRIVAALIATGALPPLAPEDCGHGGTHGHGRQRHLH